MSTQPQRLVSALDLGSSKVVALIAEVTGDQREVGCRILGLGVELSWGQLVSEAVAVVNPIQSHFWLLFWPSAFLAVTLFSLNFMGDGLRDALDPRTRR